MFSKLLSVTRVPLIYGLYPKINLGYPGTPGETYEYLFYGHFPKIDISYLSTPGGTYK